MLSTKKLSETIDFYTRVLGFTCESFVEDWGWAVVSHGEIEIMFALPNEHLPFEKPVCTGSFYFTVDDADEIWLRLKNDVKVCYPIEDFEYGMREFGIYDNNGYLLQFGHNLD